MKDREITDHGTLRVDDTTFKVADAERPAGGLYVLVAGDGMRELHPLTGATSFDIGRGGECALRIDSPLVSRNHARLWVSPSLGIEDLGSANGTFVGGRRIEQGTRVAISLGQVIELGQIVVVVHGGQAVDHEAPSRSPRSPAAGAGAPVLEDGTPFLVVDPAMRRLYDVIGRIAPSDLSVLVLGETGVGKEVIAEAVHRGSLRADAPFLRLHCAALPPTLLESELFGHERGAFTGAVQAKSGLLESAAGGTIFLDEVGEIPLEMQVRLLRVVEDRRVLRIGAREARPIDVRFVSATNRDLTAEVARGAFRRDLYYRLNGITLEVPPLRARPDEIEPLARLYLARSGSGRAALSPAALAVLREYRWPGNVRELRNAMGAAALLAGDGVVLPEHLPPELTRGDAVAEPAAARGSAHPTAAASPGAPAGPASHRDALARVEKDRILAALEQTAGNQTRAAELLGMPRRTLVKRLAEYGIARPRKRGDVG